MRNIKGETEPFWFTNNQVLATALALAGIEHTTGFPDCGCATKYDAEYLTRNGCKTVKEAQQKRKPGKFQHFFKKDGPLVECLKAYNEHNKKLDELFNGEGGTLEFLEKLPPEVRVTIALTAIRLHAHFKDAPYRVDPRLDFHDDEVSESGDNKDGGSAEFPSRKIVNAGASEARKQEVLDR